MNRDAYKSLLTSYRPGEGMESDPQIAEALRAAKSDPELMQFLEQESAFDEAFSASLHKIPVPEGLHERILSHVATQNNPRQDSRHKVVPFRAAWHYTLAGAAAAALLIFGFMTFQKQKSSPPQQYTAVAGIMESISQFPLEPQMQSEDVQELQQFVRTKGGSLPSRLPQNLGWDKSIACDVISVKGKRASMICFRVNSDVFHLFTLNQQDFPEIENIQKPVFHRQTSGQPAATWTVNGQIYVLTSQSDEKKLREVLDI